MEISKEIALLEDVLDKLIELPVKTEDDLERIDILTELVRDLRKEILHD